MIHLWNLYLWINTRTYFVTPFHLTELKLGSEGIWAWMKRLLFDKAAKYGSFPGWGGGSAFLTVSAVDLSHQETRQSGDPTPTTRGSGIFHTGCPERHRWDPLSHCRLQCDTSTLGTASLGWPDSGAEHGGPRGLAPCLCLFPLWEDRGIGIDENCLWDGQLCTK